MPDVGDRLDNVEQRLGTVETGLKEVREEVRDLREEVGDLREEVGGLRGEVGILRTEVGGLRTEVGGLRTEVNGLRVLGEKNAEDIKRVAEVQTHHGKKLEEISEALAPLAQIKDFIDRVVHEHEGRITALEKHTGIHQ